MMIEILVLVAQKVDSTIIHRINHYIQQIAQLFRTGLVIRWIVIYLVDSAIHLLNNQGLMFMMMMVMAVRTVEMMMMMF